MAGCDPASTQHKWETYLGARTGTYEFRCRRYAAVARKLQEMGLADGDLVVDVGAGRCEFDHFLRTSLGWTGRYLPVDGSLDGTDIERWAPPETLRPEFFVAIELVEHLHAPHRLMRRMRAHARKGVAVTTPNPETTDVLGMDATHVTPVHFEEFTARGWAAEKCSLFGQPEDSILAYVLRY
jgi:hypothetical protein